MTEITYEGLASPRPLAPDAVQLDGVTKTYGRGAGAVTALQDVTIALPRGSFTAVMGPSGSGKSTFMHCAAGLDRPTSGIVHLGDIDLTRLREPKLTELRRERVGFVFQAFNLLPSLTAAQNVTLPLRLAGAEPTPPGCGRCSTRSGSPIGPGTVQRSSPGASSSAWPSPARW
jgi:putative ABC transport system ATP-binding protein